MGETRTADRSRSRSRSGGVADTRAARDRLLADLPVREEQMRLAGIPTVVLRGGHGPPLVLLHGPGEHAAKWLRIIPALAKSHHIVAPDLPGHGASGTAEGGLGIDRVLDWLAELIDRSCASPPALVGQIIGGAMAARFASDRRVRLDRLILVDSLGLTAFNPAPEFGQALMAFAAAPTEDTHDALWRRCAFDLDALRDGLGEDWMSLREYNLDRARAPGLGAAQQDLMAQFGLPAIPDGALARITTPTALIWGRHDLATRLHVAQAASARYGWPLYVIENAADDPPLEQPIEFLNVLRRALTGGSATSSTATP